MTMVQISKVRITLFLLFVSGILWQSLGRAGTTPLDGKNVFAKRCSGCHATDMSKEGPRLRGVIGRRAGSVAGFQYSDALRKSGFAWNEELVKKWLENPEALVKDNDMDFRLDDPEERSAVAAYLKSLTN